MIHNSKHIENYPETHHHKHDDRETVTLKVEGMTCVNCAQGITKKLTKLGLENVNTNFGSGEVSFEIDEKLEIDEIIDSINSLGYRVLSENVKQKTQFLTIERKFYLCLIFTIPLVAHMILPWHFLQNVWFQLLLCIPVFFIGVQHFGKSAWGSLKSGIANMDVLIFIGSSSAFIYSLAGTVLNFGTSDIHNYLFYETAASIITLVLLGNLLEHRSVKQTTSAINELTQMQELTARKVILENGIEKYIEVKFKEIRIDDVLKVNSGDRIPVDGMVVRGMGVLDESMISGESVPVEKFDGEFVIGSTILVDGNLTIKAVKVGKETVLSKIIELVKKAQQQRPEIQKIGDKVSSIFVPIVLAISMFTFIYWFFIADVLISEALMTSISVLVISCPCAMGLATPTAVMVGLGRAAKNGILIKGGSTIEQLAKIKTVFFDKTGTITTGDFKVKDIKLFNNSSIEEVKSILYSLEIHSSHPIAKSIVKEFLDEAENIELIDIIEEKGQGISGKDLNGNKYKATSYASLKDKISQNNHSIYLLKNEEIIAGIDLIDDIKSSAVELINSLKQQNIEGILLSGDNKERCNDVAKKINIKQVFSEQLPHQKLEIIEKIGQKGATAMVGDGINDAPALATADVGISLSNATQVAIQSAQVILLNKNDLTKVNDALKIGKHTLITIKQNLFWAFFYNIIAIPIAASGFLSPMVAALTMAVSDVVVIGNSLRLKTKKLL